MMIQEPNSPVGEGRPAALDGEEVLPQPPPADSPSGESTSPSEIPVTTAPKEEQSPAADIPSGEGASTCEIPAGSGELNEALSAATALDEVTLQSREASAETEEQSPPSQPSADDPHDVPLAVAPPPTKEETESGIVGVVPPAPIVAERGVEAADDLDVPDDKDESDDERDRPSAFANGGGLNYLIPTDKIINGISNAKYFWGLGVEKIADKTESLKKDLPVLKAALTEKIQNADLTGLKEQGNQKLSVLLDSTKSGLGRAQEMAQSANAKVQVKLQSTVDAWLGDEDDHQPGDDGDASQPAVDPAAAAEVSVDAAVAPTPPFAASQGAAEEPGEAPAMIV
jgi:hypothetical protein